MYANRQNFRVFRKSGSRNTMVTSDFRPEVEIRPFRACAIKICNITLIFGRIAEIFAYCRKSGSRNTIVTSDLRAKVEIWPFCACVMHPAICMNSSFIVDLAIGQIPRSTKRISSIKSTLVCCRNSQFCLFDEIIILLIVTANSGLAL